MGYQKVTLYPGLNMIGGLFQDVGTGESHTLQTQFADDATKAKFGTGDDVADTIMTYDGESQEYDKTYYFYADPDNPDPTYDYTWDDTATDDITDFAVKPGQGFWYRHRGAGATLTFTRPYAVQTNN